MQSTFPTLSPNNSLIMGIVNVTPDSFSDGGLYYKSEQAIEHGIQLAKQGADILDIGGESTRPGAKAVSVQEELDRVIPVIYALKNKVSIPISIDTSKAEVMLEAVKAGALMINDIFALQKPQALEVAAELGVPVCIMHMQGQPQTMQKEPVYQDIIQDINIFFQQRINICIKAGIKQENIILDPGIGFGKTLEHNLIILKNVEEFKKFQMPLLIGASRKSLIGHLLNQAPVADRLYGSIALHTLMIWLGVSIIRVHDVKPMRDALNILKAIKFVEK